MWLWEAKVESVSWYVELPPIFVAKNSYHFADSEYGPAGCLFSRLGGKRLGWLELVGLGRLISCVWSWLAVTSVLGLPLCGLSSFCRSPSCSWCKHAWLL